MRTITSFGIERVFQSRYTSSLARVRRAFITNTTVLGLSGGMALSSYLVMMAVAIVYGCYRLAGELEASRFPFKTNYTDPTYGITVEAYYCADADGQLVNVSFGDTCDKISQLPYYMSCQFGATLANVGSTKMGALAEGQAQAAANPSGGLKTPCDPPAVEASSSSSFEVPKYMENMTMLELFNLSAVGALGEYVQQQAPPEYLNTNPGYYDCTISGTNILLAVFAVMMMGEGFSMAGSPANQLAIGRQAAAKILAIINRPPPIDSFSEDGAKPAKVSGDIQVKDVVFAYPSSPDTLVCRGYNLSIAAGQTVALCGPSGSGKSTIIQLIERFYDPHSGSITLDGYDIKTLNVRWLRSQMGLVSQEPLLFQGTVAQNIAYGVIGGGATQGEIQEAAKMANAHAFITERLADGYNTQVGQGGNKLSGGQKQRVAIARAIIKRPSVLLLDEATSALDTKSEKVVQAALDEIMTKMRRTTIVIAHRLSTIRNADKIAVLREGAVVEEGTYDSLMTIQDGLFRSLAEKQEELLKADKAAVGSNKHGPQDDDADAPLDAAVVAQATVVAAENEADEATPGKKGKKKKKTTEKDEAKEKDESAPIGRIFKMQSDQALSLLLMGLGSAFACAVSVWSFYQLVVVFEFPYLTNPDTMRSRALCKSAELAVYAAIMVGSFMFAGFFNGVAGSSLTAKLRALGIASLMRQEMGFFDREENSAAELTAFLAEKVDKVKTITTEQFDLVCQLIGAFGGFIYVLVVYSDWRLLLAWLAFIVLMSVVAPLQAAFIKGEDSAETKKKKGKEDTSKSAEAATSANRIVGDAVMGIRTVASFNLEHQFYESFCESSGKVAAYAQQDALMGGFALCFVQLTMFSGMGLVFFYSMWLADQGFVTMSEFFAPMFAMTGIMVPMMKAGALADIKSASNAAVRLFRVFDRVPAIDNLDESGRKLESVTGDIQVKDVVFSYPTAPDHLVCRGYSLSIAAGQTVALCGPSGSGKSTIIALIERFYDPQQGVVTLDGVDIKTLNVRWLRSQLGLVAQEPVLFQGTVAQNIAYGASEGVVCGTKEVEEAAKMANAHEFIMNSLGDGYQTDVGLKGGKLSGGQKQRVAIARAIVRKPSVLLLDEATSALDNESERIVQAALDEIMTKMRRTTIVIAHRLSTIRNADKIAVVSEGSIVEEGTHDELLANHGLYTNLVMST